MTNACNLLLEECDILKNWENNDSHPDNKQYKSIRMVSMLKVRNKIERVFDSMFHVFIKKGGFNLHSKFDYAVW